MAIDINGATIVQSDLRYAGFTITHENESEHFLTYLKINLLLKPEKSIIYNQGDETITQSLEHYFAAPARAGDRPAASTCLDLAAARGPELAHNREIGQDHVTAAARERW